MDIEKKRSIIDELKADIALKQKHIAAIEKEIAVHLCQFVVGDVITRGHGVMRVEDIVHSIFPIGYEMILRRIRADGHPGRYTHKDRGSGFRLAN